MNSLKISTKKSIILILSYFIIYNFIFPILAAIIILYNNFDSIIVNAIFDILYLIIIYLNIKDIIIEGFNKFKKNLKDNTVELLKQTLLILAVNIFSSLLIGIVFNVQTSQNQQMVNELLTSYFWYTVFSSCIFAPIVEETIFRLAIFRTMYKNSFWFPALVSSIAFGGIHVLGSLLLGNYLDLVNIITYSLMGLVICAYYYRKDNFFAPIMLHMMNNLIGVLLFLV